MHTDLFGHPIEVMLPVIEVDKPRPRRKNPEAARRKALREELKNPTFLLFEEVLEYLRRPILPIDIIPEEFRSDLAGVVAADEEETETVDYSKLILPYEAWGEVWFVDKNGLSWSRNGCSYLQNRIFWRSMEEMTLKNNDEDKWSVLKWVFSPAIVRHYVWIKKIGASRYFDVHERDYTFSFHNCAMAARIEKDAIREGFSRNLPADLIKAVLRVVNA